MSKEHHYGCKVTWTGSLGQGTVDYASYERNFDWHVEGKHIVKCSSDKPFRGDGTLHNPEDMLLAALSSCHMLWYLHLCADNGIVVLAYEDSAIGTLSINSDGIGKFSTVTLRPKVLIKNGGDELVAKKLHHEANKKCFIANSCNIAVEHDPEIMTSR